ncbi:non-hydrolyzing UDP-N-acetylglucosamine 2-epimerase [Proteiniphilum propionicum]|jgi:UDP-N-acetylglucosamine 2-epimerase (non-hydrolysing)|uniref:non-hydrolyzing UDP-N-acetylglucosamine 2-epimerase n=1 Tax=Proteiniphilum propionicum TaxID=2829812 RepID=UPI001EE9EE82|nr:UDP-N-acetylglucosamine 2-epimerase (non-hydrolyzing) [Proteiniphilum propionicum]ULB33516.1 UDP-N-acetylglucosamine 2-epimerase (non-hydrolyzing) [Proteiniphilum propionicum]
MDKIKLMTLVGTRPEIIKLSEVIKKCDTYFNHILVHTGQNYDYKLNEIFFKDLGLRNPDHYLGVVGEDLGETIGNVIAKSYKIMQEEKPDAILILGDTNSALAAISAKRLKISIFHMEAGNRCFDENLPEEINRRIVDHISDINLPYTEHARRYLFSEGVKKESIFVTGSPMAEVISVNKEKIESNNVLDELKIEKGKYILLSAHREENIDNETNFSELMNAVNAMAVKYNLPVIYSMHPRSKKYITQRNFKFNELIRPLEPFGFSDYISLQKNALCVVSDSGTLAEESALLNFPSVSIRTSTERPEVLDKGSFIIGSISEKSLLQAVDMAVMMSANNEESVVATDYVDTNVSIKVVKIIQSYIDIINRKVWGKLL